MSKIFACKVFLHYILIIFCSEFTTWTQAPEISRRLHSKYFSVSVLLATQSIITENMFLACVDNSYNIYKLNGISEINNNAIVKMTVDWICRGN